MGTFTNKQRDNPRKSSEHECKRKIVKMEGEIKVEQQVREDVTQKEEHEKKFRMSSCGKTDGRHMTHIKSKCLRELLFISRRC
jgi:hypothetical protein